MDSTLSPMPTTAAYIAAIMEMCREAILSRKDRTGSSRSDINSYILATYGKKPTAKALTTALAKGIFINNEGRYKLAGSRSEEASKTAKVATCAADEMSADAELDQRCTFASPCTQCRKRSNDLVDWVCHINGSRRFYRRPGCDTSMTHDSPAISASVLEKEETGIDAAWFEAKWALLHARHSKDEEAKQLVASTGLKGSRKRQRDDADDVQPMAPQYSETFLVAIKRNGEALEYLPPELQGNETIVIAALQSVKLKSAVFDDSSLRRLVRFSHASLWETEKFVLKAVRVDGSLLEFAKAGLNANLSIVTQAVETNGRALKHASTDLQANANLVQKAYGFDNEDAEAAAKWLRRIDGKLRVGDLSHISMKLREDEEFMRQLIEKDGSALRYASGGLKSRPSLVLAALETKVKIIEHAHANLKDNPEFMLQAVAKSDHTLKEVSKELWKDKDFMVSAAVAMAERSQQHTHTHKTLKATFKRREDEKHWQADSEFVLNVVTRVGTALQYASDGLTADHDIVRAAVEQDRSALKYVSEDLLDDIDFMCTLGLRPEDDAFLTEAGVIEDRDMIYAGGRGREPASLLSVPSDDSVKAELTIIVPEVDIDAVSINQIMGMLTQKFGEGVKQKKPVVKETVKRLLAAMQPEDDENPEVDEIDSNADDSDDDDCDKASVDAFTKADTNNNGYLSKEETKMALGVLGQEEDLDFSTVLSEMDVDRNGKVSLQEFQNWWRLKSSAKDEAVLESSDTEPEADSSDEDSYDSDSDPPTNDDELSRVLSTARFKLRPSTPAATSTPLTDSVVYPKQIEVAEKLFQKIQLQLGDALTGFDDFIPIVLIPDQNTLYDQTIRRMDEFFSHYQGNRVETPGFNSGCCKAYGDGGTSSSSLVVKPGGSDSAERLKKICQRIQSNPHTLFLFIHDEAHWAATANKIGTGEWQPAEGANSWINNDIIRLSPNAVTLFVSATPYNLLTKRSQVPETNTEYWFTPGDASNTSTVVYYGLKQFVQKTQKRNEALERIVDVDGDSTPPGCLLVDDQFEKHVGHPKKGNMKAWNIDRKDKLIAQYVAALEKIAERQVDEDPSNISFSIVQDLLTQTEDGKGIMILIRVLEKDHGRDIRKALCKARAQLGLVDKFAVILDVDATNKKSLRKCIDAEFQDKMAKWQGEQRADDVTIVAYSDLVDLPCILILCEKGKMGDTFPESLRHYDLRLRYAGMGTHSRATAEQDLGRAFRYVKPGRKDRVPTVIVGHSIYRSLSLEKRAGKTLNLWKQADARMKSKNVPKDGWPKTEYDMTAYRNYYEPTVPKKPTKKKIQAAEGTGKQAVWDPGHFDSQYRDRKNWTNNPLRFLLVGLPQIGKTGAFLHLTYLLWKQVDSNVGRYEVGPAPDPPDRIDFDNVGEYPNFDLMEKIEWSKQDCVKCPASCKYARRQKLNKHGNFGCPDHSPGYGKYGDPKVEALWKWNVVDEKRAKHPDADQYSSASLGGAEVKQQKKSRSSVTAAPQESQSASPQGSDPKPAEAMVDKSTHEGIDANDAEAQAEKVIENGDFDLKRWSGRKASAVQIKVFKVQTEFRGKSLDLGRLTIPVTAFNEWWQCEADNKPIIKLRNEANVVKFPIFMPTHGRAGNGLLDLRNSMRVPSSDPAADPLPKPLQYLQILVVKSGMEYQLYRSRFPQLTIYELPHESNNLGIGDARFCIQQLADVVCPLNMLGNGDSTKYCFVLDDSTKGFIGLTLPNDRCPPFGKKETGKMQWSVVSLGQTLMYLQSPRFRYRKKFAAVGFHRKGYGRIECPYARAHIYSALLLNITWLKESEVYFNRKVWLWEDLDFNRRVSAKGGVLCKCYRYQQVTAQLKSGGCSSLVARGAGLPVTCVVRSVISGTEKCHGEITGEFLSRAVRPNDSHGLLPDIVVARLRENLQKRFKPEIADSMVEKLDVTHLNDKQLMQATPLDQFSFVGEHDWDTRVDTIRVVMALNSEPTAAKNTGIDVKVSVVEGGTLVGEYELPRSCLVENSHGPVPIAALHELSVKHTGALEVSAVNGEPVSAAAAAEVGAYVFRFPWKDTKSIILVHSGGAPTPSSRHLKSLDVAEVGLFAVNIFSPPVKNWSEYGEQIAKENLAKEQINGDALCEYSEDDLGEIGFIGPRRRHLFAMVKKAIANGVGPNLLPLRWNE